MFFFLSRPLVYFVFIVLYFVLLGQVLIYLNQGYDEIKSTQGVEAALRFGLTGLAGALSSYLIAAFMFILRMRDAGHSAVWGVLTLIPGINILALLCAGFLPSLRGD